MDRCLLARTLGAVLRDTRRRRGYSLADLARRTSIGESAISRAETGKQLPDLPTLVRLADGLRTSAWRLMYAVEKVT